MDRSLLPVIVFKVAESVADDDERVYACSILTHVDGMSEMRHVERIT